MPGLTESAELSIVIRAKDEASQAFDKVKASSEESSGGFGKFAGVAAAGLVLVGTAAIGAASFAIDMADKYQDALATIGARTGDTTAQVDAIGKAFLSTAGTVTFTATDIATAFAPVAGQLATTEGHALTAAESLQVMKASMDLAEASGQPLASTTADLAKVMQSFQLPTQQAAQASDELFNSSVALGVPVDSLTTSLQRARTAAGAAAPSLGDLSAFMLDLAQHGETGRGAVSLLNTALTGIEVPTKAVAAAQDQLGVSFLNSKGQLDPLSQIIAEVSPKIEGMGNAQAVATLKAIGFGGASSKLVDVMQAGPAAFDAATLAVNKTGTAHLGAETATATFSGSFEKLKAQVIDTAIQFGQKLQPAVTAIMNWISTTGLPILEKIITALVAGLGPAFNVIKAVVSPVVDVLQFLGQHLDIVLPLVIGLGAAFAGYEAYMFITGMITAFTTALALFQAGLAGATAAEVGGSTASYALGAAIDFMTGPIGLVILAVAAIIAIGALLITHWQQVVAIAETVWKDVSGFFTNLWHDITAIVGDIINWVKQNWMLLVAILTGPIGLAIAWIGTHITQIANFFKAIPGDIVHALSGFAAIVWGFLSGEFVTLLKNFTLWVLDLLKWWVTLPLQLGQALIGMAATVWTFLSKEFGVILTDILNWMVGVVKYYESLPGRFVSAMAGIGGAIGGFLVGEFNHVTAVITGWISTAVGFFAGLPGDMGKAFVSFGGDLAAGFKTVVNDAIIGPIDAALKYIGDLGGSIGPLSFHIRDAFGGSMPQIPKLAGGGIVDSPTLLMAGEAGKEWIINQQQAGPLGGLLDSLVLGNGAGFMGASSGAAAGGGGGQSMQPLVIPITLTLDGKVISTVVARHQGKAARLQGYGAGAR